MKLLEALRRHHQRLVGGFRRYAKWLVKAVLRYWGFFAGAVGFVAAIAGIFALLQTSPEDVLDELEHHDESVKQLFAKELAVDPFERFKSEAVYIGKYQFPSRKGVREIRFPSETCPNAPCFVIRVSEWSPDNAEVRFSLGGTFQGVSGDAIVTLPIPTMTGCWNTFENPWVSIRFLIEDGSSTSIRTWVGLVDHAFKDYRHESAANIWFLSGVRCGADTLGELDRARIKSVPCWFFPKGRCSDGQEFVEFHLDHFTK